MADIASAATAARCQLNASLSASIVNDRSELMNFYKKWSDKYDEDFREEHYVGPRLAVETVCQFVASHERSEMTVVDVAAGTGLVGLELFNNGFRVIDAVDGSEDMLAKLNAKGVYRRTTQAMLGNGAASQVNLPKDHYDVVTCSGGFVPGHLPTSAVYDLIHLCKPGGLIVIVMRYEYLTVGDEHQHMEPLMIELEERHGLWQRVKRQISPNYLLDKEGIIFAYRKSSTK